MKKIDIVNGETGEVLWTVTTRYNSLATLLDNVSKWMKRHPEYKNVTAEELGFKWSAEEYWVKEV